MLTYELVPCTLTLLVSVLLLLLFANGLDILNRCYFFFAYLLIVQPFVMLGKSCEHFFDSIIMTSFVCARMVILWCVLGNVWTEF